MIIGVGSDLVDIRRVEATLARFEMQLFQLLTWHFQNDSGIPRRKSPEEFALVPGDTAAINT